MVIVSPLSCGFPLQMAIFSWLIDGGLLTTKWGDPPSGGSIHVPFLGCTCRHGEKKNGYPHPFPFSKGCNPSYAVYVQLLF